MKPLKDDYNIVVKAEDRQLIDSSYKVIVWYINQQRNVPFNIVQSFIDCLYDANQLKRKQLFEKADELAKKAFEKIKDQKGYQFEWHPTVETFEDNRFEVIEYTTEKVLSECIAAFLLMEEDLKTVRKEDAISLFYEVLIEEYYKRVKLKEGEKFKPYKWMVITGILAQTVGYKLTNKKNPTNEEIFQAVRYVLKNRKP